MKGIHNYANWHYFDTYWYGRCVSLQTNNSIKTINLKLQVESKIFIHTPGMLLEGDGGQRIQERYIKQGETNGLHLDYEYHQLLDVDYGKAPCKKEKAYLKDFCTAKMIEKELIDKVGCTTPFGPDKSQICKQEDKGRQAHHIYERIIRGDNFSDRCENPCSIFSLTTTNFKKHVNFYRGTEVIIHFPKNIKVFERSYTYSPLSLLAEIGGYVGLFLGISINQTINLLEYVVTKLVWIYKCSRF